MNTPRGPYIGVMHQALQGLAALDPADADVAEAARAIVDMPHGCRPFRCHIDPSQDGAEVVNVMADRVCAKMFRRIGLEDLLRVGGQ